MRRMGQNARCAWMAGFALLLGLFPTPSDAAAAPLTAVIDQLQAHLDGATPLAADKLLQFASQIEAEGEQVASDAATLRRALKVVDTYEATNGPLFISKATRDGFPRKPAGGLELDRALFALQQALLDHAFTPQHLAAYQDVLDGAAFKTAAYFPGAVAAKPEPEQVYRVTINASQPAAWGSPVMFTEDPARRPTGCYLAPGSIATVTVPPALVGKGFGVRVGAHSWDLEARPVIKRLDRVSLVFPIEATETRIANPLGGGIYLEVPYLAEAGLVEVGIQNVVRSPFFSARSFDQTTLEAWQKTARRHPGPWADFESDRFMMQVPSNWISAYDDPATMMADWDKALDVVSTLFGYPAVRPKSVLYLQIDVVYRGTANFPGYPQSNFRYNPHKPEDGHSDHWLLQGPQSDGAVIFHELGHAQLFTKFRGETEAVVNLPYVAVLNKAFGVDLDTAFGRSFNNERLSLDQAAIMWMVTQNFRDGQPMDISNSSKNEVRYQHRGYAKYVEIAKLFGWQVLEGFWKSNQIDYLNGITYERNADPTDSRILRLSQQAGVDLTPLIHFWGVQPDDPSALRAAVGKAGLKPSATIYDRLQHYQTLIPMSREAFAQHAAVIYPKGVRDGQKPDFGEGWYTVWLKHYDHQHGEAAQAALQGILDAYFPEGRPAAGD